jgi:anti-sigma-K factor RskA
LWERIRAAIGHSEPQAPIVLPDAPPAAAAEIAVSEPVAVPVIDDSNVIRLAAQARRWRNLASAMTALAAALIAMLAVEVFQPDVLPGSLRSKPRVQVVEVRTPQAAPVLSGQYVAILQGQAGAPAFILTVDGTTKNFTVRKIGAPPEAGKSFELWLISDKLPRPRSLGVIGGGDFTARPVLSGYDQDVINGATYAVTVEQAGGSPDGVPHSTPIYTGKLIETVPPATPAPNR